MNGGITYRDMEERKAASLQAEDYRRQIETLRSELSAVTALLQAEREAHRAIAERLNAMLSEMDGKL